jgi:two-component system CheB/CheR fusion protein
MRPSALRQTGNAQVRRLIEAMERGQIAVPPDLQSAISPLRQWIDGCGHAVGADPHDEAPAQVQTYRAELEAVFHAVSEGIVVCDMDGQTVLANDAVARISGLASAAAMPRDLACFASLYRLTDGDGRPVPLEQWPMSRVLRGESVVNCELHALHGQTGREWDLSFSGEPVRDEDGRQILGVVIARDITAARAARDALHQRAVELDAARLAAEQARIEAEVANQAKDQFLANLSHELRNPLTPVLAVAGIMQSDSRLPADVRDDAAMIRRNIAIQTRLIDDLLDLTRITRGKVDLDLREVDLAAVLRQTLEICAVDLAAKSLRLEVEADACAHRVRADPARLHQIFWNLLKNAIKFTPAHGHIHVRCAARGKRRVAIRFSDNGIGIDSELLPKLFHPFEQGRRSVTRHLGGLGLGLAITKMLVDLHGGRIRAHSPGNGRGATFTVELPLA